MIVKDVEADVELFNDFSSLFANLVKKRWKLRERHADKTPEDMEFCARVGQ